MPAWAGQGKYGVGFQWGPVVAPALSEGVCVVVDVLRFTTAVEAAVSRGVAVYPYRWRDATAAAVTGGPARSRGDPFLDGGGPVA
jgi:2-phosphosulfolactate phosphatase